MTNNLLKFPSIRMAFKQTTDALDNLAQEATRYSSHEVADAYRTAFSLVREGIKQAENLGESKLQKQIVDAMDEVLTERHRELDKKVAEDYANRLNSEEYNKEKLNKLNLKQEIEALKQIIKLKEQQDILVHNSEK